MLNSATRRFFVCVLHLALVSMACAQWLGVAGNRARTSTAGRAPRDLSHLRWCATPAENEQYVAQSTPAVAVARVFVNARVFSGLTHVGNRLIAYDAVDGARLWSADVEADFLSSWTSPAIDENNGTVLLATNDDVYSFDQVTGACEWTLELDRRVVNSSPLVTADLTSGGVPANRALIADYSGFGSGAKLYAINVDPFDASLNPYKPGESVWTLDLGRAAGATPAYVKPWVYLATGGGDFLRANVSSPIPDPNHPGSVLPDWRTTVAINGLGDGAGFFGGVSIAGTALFAASYNFVGGENSAQLFKIDAGSGAEVWQAPCERTDSIPIPLGGEVWLSGGLAGFGSAFKLQRFRDNGGSATTTWDSGQAAFSPVIGGWTHHTAIAHDFVYVGTPESPDPNAPPPGGMNFDPYGELLILDSRVDPNQPTFLVDRFAGAGGSPALAHGRLFSIGAEGLFAFDPSPACAADVNGDGVVGLTDLSLILSHFDGTRGAPKYNANYDINLDAAINLDDLSLVLAYFDDVCD